MPSISNEESYKLNDSCYVIIVIYACGLEKVVRYYNVDSPTYEVH